MQNQDFVIAIDKNNFCPILGWYNNAPHSDELPFSEDGCFLRLRRLFASLPFLLPARARSNEAFSGSCLVVDKVSGIDWSFTSSLYIINFVSSQYNHLYFFISLVLCCTSFSTSEYLPEWFSKRSTACSQNQRPSTLLPVRVVLHFTTLHRSVTTPLLSRAKRKGRGVLLLGHHLRAH